MILYLCLGSIFYAVGLIGMFIFATSIWIPWRISVHQNIDYLEALNLTNYLITGKDID